MDNYTLCPPELDPAGMSGRHVDYSLVVDSPPRTVYATAYIVPKMGGKHRG